MKFSAARISVCLFRMSSHSFSAYQTPDFFFFSAPRSRCMEKFSGACVKSTVGNVAHRTALDWVSGRRRQIVQNSSWLRELSTWLETPRKDPRGSSFPEKLRRVETEGRSGWFWWSCAFSWGCYQERGCYQESERKRCIDECCAAVRAPGGPPLLIEDQGK